MQKVCILFLGAVTAGLSLPTDTSMPRQLQSEFAEIEQTVTLDLLIGLAREILDNLHRYTDSKDSPIFGLFDRINDFLQNDFDPDKTDSQTTQLKIVVGILNELLDYLQSIISAKPTI